MTSETSNSYPTGDAGSDSESGTVDAAQPEGADESVEQADSAELTEDGSLGAGSTAVGSPTSGGLTEADVDATVAGKPAATPQQSNPNSLIEGNRVATAEDME